LSRGWRLSWLGVLALPLFSLPSRAIAAERQIRPLVGVTFGGSTTFVDLEGASGRANPAIGLNAVVLGEIVGIDLDLALAPGFFQAGDRHLVLASSVTTLTGNFVLAAPGRVTEYGLRPYFVGGAGLMRVRIDDYFGVLRVTKTMPAIDIGGGAIGFVTKRVGVCWDVRRFTSLSRTTEENGISFGREQLSFWRASMMLVIRY
jgi:hypothetical protein